MITLGLQGYSKYHFNILPGKGPEKHAAPCSAEEAQHQLLSNLALLKDKTSSESSVCLSVTTARCAEFGE